MGDGLVGGGQGGCERNLGVGVMWGMGTKNRRYCTMYNKVLYNIKKINVGGGGGGAIFEPKTLSIYLKKKKKKKSKKEKKKMTEPGLMIRTHDLRVRNPLG